ncbi:MAG: thioredoxin family protein [Thermoleophilia bacterium]
MTGRTPAEPIRVELWHVADCPNGTAYLPRLRRLLAEAGSPAVLSARVVHDVEQARRERVPGSPTVRVDGRDVEPGADDRGGYGLSCRLYATPDGLGNTPPDAWVLAALARAGAPTTPEGDTP